MFNGLKKHYTAVATNIKCSLFLLRSIMRKLKPITHLD